MFKFNYNLNYLQKNTQRLPWFPKTSHGFPRFPSVLPLCCVQAQHLLRSVLLALVGSFAQQSGSAAEEYLRATSGSSLSTLIVRISLPEAPPRSPVRPPVPGAFGAGGSNTKRRETRSRKARMPLGAHRVGGTQAVAGSNEAKKVKK